MRLFAVSDLHVSHAINRRALEALRPREDDWLILAGDVCESEKLFDSTLHELSSKFARLVWVPGNHELWTYPEPSRGARGEAKYAALVSICREHGVVTPEDPFCAFSDASGSYLLAPLFTLYDYSFRPPEVAAESALGWALEAGILCADELYLHPEPYASVAEWCKARCERTLERLRALDRSAKLILIDHFPLRYDLICLPAIPRFSIWCGTRETEGWHVLFNASVVISGHLHRPSTQWRDGVRFEEVSLGYPGQWNASKGIAGSLRQILPYPGDR